MTNNTFNSSVNDNSSKVYGSYNNNDNNAQSSSSNYESQSPEKDFSEYQESMSVDEPSTDFSGEQDSDYNFDRSEEKTEEPSTLFTFYEFVDDNDDIYKNALNYSKNLEDIARHDAETGNQYAYTQKDLDDALLHRDARVDSDDGRTWTPTFDENGNLIGLRSAKEISSDIRKRSEQNSYNIDKDGKATKSGLTGLLSRGKDYAAEDEGLKDVIGKYQNAADTYNKISEDISKNGETETPGIPKAEEDAIKAAEIEKESKPTAAETDYSAFESEEPTVELFEKPNATDEEVAAAIDENPEEVIRHIFESPYANDDLEHKKYGGKLRTDKDYGSEHTNKTRAEMYEERFQRIKDTFGSKAFSLKDKVKEVVTLVRDLKDITINGDMSLNERRIANTVDRVLDAATSVAGPAGTIISKVLSTVFRIAFSTPTPTSSGTPVDYSKLADAFIDSYYIGKYKQSTGLKNGAASISNSPRDQLNDNFNPNDVGQSHGNYNKGLTKESDEKVKGYIRTVVRGQPHVRNLANKLRK